jgi:hypothetical protein
MVQPFHTPSPPLPHCPSSQVEDAFDAVTQLAQTTMRSELGKLTLDKTFEERESLNHNIVQAINEAAKVWGVRCLRYEIRTWAPVFPRPHMATPPICFASLGRVCGPPPSLPPTPPSPHCCCVCWLRGAPGDITPPVSVKAAMDSQAEAERRKRAEILESEGLREAAINTSEGKRQGIILQARGESEAIIARATATGMCGCVIPVCALAAGGGGGGGVGCAGGK